MATQTKAQFLAAIQNLLKQKPKQPPSPDKLSILEAVVLGICHEGIPRDRALEILERFKADYFDWNEVRVSPLDQIKGTLGDLPDVEARALAIRRFLRQLFEKTYGFTLDALLKKPQKDALKTLGEFDAFRSPYVEATVIRLALGGHAIPVDASLKHALSRLESPAPDVTDEELRNLLERAVPKNRGADFLMLVDELAFEPGFSLADAASAKSSKSENGAEAKASKAKGETAKAHAKPKAEPASDEPRARVKGKSNRST